MHLQTIANLLHEQAQARPDAIAYTFLDGTGEPAGQRSFSQLLQEAHDAGAALAHYPAQARIVIALPTSAQFCAVFYGCMLGGKVAVPTPLPNVHRFGAVLQIVAQCQASCIVTIPSLLPGLRLALQEAGLADVQVCDYDGLLSGGGTVLTPPTADDIALLQFTSGSTAAPKGVIITHANILANETMIYSAFGHSAQSTVVGWVPLHHDQGLIGNLIQPLYAGSHCVLFDPLTFLRTPLLWLKTISRYGAHTSGGPNFAYDLCVNRIKPDDCAGLDLSSWRLAFNGAEPVNAATLRRFAEKFGPYGFRAGSFFVCYGLAEATLYVSGSHVAAAVFEGSQADAQAALPLSAGRPHPQISILLRPQQSAEATMTGEEICIAGPSVSRGYWGARSPESFFEHEGKHYLRTGDIGHLQQGQLHIAGRAKELMIIRGRNVYPYDLERTITASHDVFLENACAVIALDMHDEHGQSLGQEVVAVQEVQRSVRHALDYNEMAGLIRKKVVRQHDVLLKRILFAKPGFIPKTSSGKIKRNELAASLVGMGTAHASAFAKIIATE
jgi:acyl-CoA synthetase (AMP-forming)/AMP-acid ligase II